MTAQTGQRIFACIFLIANLFATGALAQDSTLEIIDVAPGNFVINRPVLKATGEDENIYIDYWTKGGGAHVFRGWGGGAHAFVAYAQDINGQNFLEAHGTVGPPQLRATGPGTNIDLMLHPQNNGVVIVRNGIQLVTIDAGGTVTNVGFLSLHKNIFGGSSTDVTFRAEPGNAIRFFVGGGTEAMQLTTDGALGLAPIAAPTVKPGLGQLFIDNFDGDLKMLFSNGALKTIANN